MTPPRKQPKRVRRMWASEPPGLSFEVYKTKQEADNYGDYPGENFPVCVIPTDAASVEEMVERAANALACEHMGALPGSYSLTLEKDCAKGSESAYMWRSARAVVRDLLGLKGRK